MRCRAPPKTISMPSCEQAFAAHASRRRRLPPAGRPCLLEHAGADAAEHVFGAAPLEDHVVDAGLVQQRAEQQARGAGADDRDLGAFRSHDSPS